MSLGTSINILSHPDTCQYGASECTCAEVRSLTHLHPVFSQISCLAGICDRTSLMHLPHTHLDILWSSVCLRCHATGGMEQDIMDMTTWDLVLEPFAFAYECATNPVLAQVIARALAVAALIMYLMSFIDDLVVALVVR